MNDLDKQEFDQWWVDSHCEGDGGEAGEKNWAISAFDYGIEYAQQMRCHDLESYEETVSGLTRQAVMLRERVDSLEKAQDTRAKQIRKLKQVIEGYKKLVDVIVGVL